MTRILCTLSFMFTMFPITLSAHGALNGKTVASEELQKIFQQHQPVHLLDIQKKHDFLLHHFFNALATDAYPVKTRTDTAKIEPLLKRLQSTNDPIIIIGPRGTRASQRALTFLIQKGISPERLSILEKGIQRWPAPEILQNTAGQ